jgi:hypothetical protein
LLYKLVYVLNLTLLARQILANGHNLELIEATVHRKCTRGDR